MIVAGLTNSFLLELPKAIHDFEDDDIKIALYESTAELGPDTGAYTAVGEVSGAGYTAGGILLTATIASGDGYSFVDFADASWAEATITARGALIYNASKENRSIGVVNFGTDKSSSDDEFLLVFPIASATEALIRFRR